ncbi:hypothetical protein O6H91_17G053700 [Diphasiastrum complanatum]|uniref:Uncharacterized protein n=1 Tax=Diphasiastrum complanatum TaxID=34168 RepID=A0ACC2B6S3_DIPCM|nr:hypothetical protein O6H91_17G053700 [Diphasiastrum complanatum]
MAMAESVSLWSRPTAVGLSSAESWQQGQSLRAARIPLQPQMLAPAPAQRLAVARAATQSEGIGTRYIGGKRKVKVLQVGDKSANLRDKVNNEGAAVKLLSRVEQLRLLSKAEKAGLLSSAESFGLSLSSIEKLGLLSKAEDLGVLSAATDPSTPGALLTTALALLISGPIFVYLIPEDSTGLVVLQYLIALVTVFGGSAAFAASNFVSNLQKAD